MTSLLIGLAALSTSHAGQTPEYRDIEIRGWKAHVERSLFNSLLEWNPVREELDKQLYQIVRVVPHPALGQLKQIPIWVHRKAPMTLCMAYHPGKEYLVEHGMDPNMVKGIEVGCAETFLSWTIDQPWMVLHELAHGYHDRFLSSGYENPGIKTAYEVAMKANLYKRVRFWDGRERDGYAATNQMEYFGELTEALFGQNDMFPFVRGELAQYDAGGLQAVADAWGVKDLLSPTRKKG